VATRLLPLALAPATVFGVWAVLAGAGIALAVLMQGWVTSARHVAVPHLLAVSLAAVAAGVVGAKAWYMVVHRDEHRRDGWCIQGLVSGVAIVGVALAGALGVPIGTFLDVTAPGLLFGMAVGRVGCFFAGCCHGRPTSSRWGIWSSDRRVGVRRIPTQLLESLLAAAVGAGALAGSLSEPVPRGGVLVAALGAYTLVRQRLLAWRAEPRQSSWLTTMASAAAAVMAVAGVVAAAVS
jgi:phosphatidylglycerol:prolipoprotein diacylglycerol transferase